MESAVCVSGFFLLLFSTGVYLSPHPKVEFGYEGGDVDFFPSFSEVDDYVLYRVYEDGALLLLINCSQPVRPQSDEYAVECVEYSYEYTFKLSKLTLSQSGDYRAEGWTGGNITGHTSFHLTVCADGHSSDKVVSFGSVGSVEVCSLNSTLGHGSSLQLYRYDMTLKNFVLVLDTSSSLEPLVEDLKGQLQVDLNSSVLTIPGVTQLYSGFICKISRGPQCQSYSLSLLKMGPKHVFTYEGENVTLSCNAKRELHYLVYWTTPTEVVLSDEIRPSTGMNMLNGSQAGDYSLIIPSVSLNQSGEYMCESSDTMAMAVLYVCSKLSPLELMFSPGQRVLLNITEHLNNFSVDGAQWYLQRVLQPQVQIVDLDYRYEKTSMSLPEDLKGRVTVSAIFNSSLIISNLTAEDRGMYTWRVYLSNMSAHACYEGSFRLVYLDPLEAQSEDEDLQDDVEMAELIAPPPAASDEAAEHNV